MGRATPQSESAGFARQGAGKAADLYERKKGQPALNQSGRNGWIVLREKYRGRLERDIRDLRNVLIAVAETGDVQALRLALEPILDVRVIELSGSYGAPLPSTVRAAATLVEYHQREHSRRHLKQQARFG